MGHGWCWAALYLHTGAVAWGAFWASLVPGLLIMSLAVVNAIPDFHQDRLVGKRNLVVRIGRRKAVWLYVGLAASALVVVALGVAAGQFPRGCLAALLAAPLLVKSARAARSTYERPRDFIPAVRSVVACYVVAVTLFVAGDHGARLDMSATNRIDSLRAPLLVSWQLTRDCDLCCLHCCTESAPGKRMRDELDRDEAMRVVDEIVRNEVPYVMLCGGEPLVVPHFLEIAEALGNAGVRLKIETNGQKIDAAMIERLARLPIRSIQISLDGDTEEVYQAQRPGGSLAKAHAACRAIRAAGLPLEITFAPTRLNIHEASAVIDRARSLGAFGFNTGMLMRIGTAARQWKNLEPTQEQYRAFREMLDRRAHEGGMALQYTPFEMAEGLRGSLAVPPATLLVLPNGWVKVAAAIPHVCADLRVTTLESAWWAYREAWRDPAVTRAVAEAIEQPALHAEANRWKIMAVAT